MCVPGGGFEKCPLCHQALKARMVPHRGKGETRDLKNQTVPGAGGPWSDLGQAAESRDSRGLALASGTAGQRPRGGSAGAEVLLGRAL